MTEREFAAVCPLGHRNYLRLYMLGDPPLTKPCRKCDRPARLVELPPVPCRHPKELDVSDQIGHARESTTLNTYGHLIRDRRGERSATLAARFGRDAPQ